MRNIRLRHRITIQQNTPTQGADGYPEPSWSTFAERWASFKEVSGSETFDEQRNIARKAVEFWIRYLSGVVPAMRISYDGRLFDIQSVVDPDGLKRWQKLMCVEFDV